MLETCFSYFPLQSLRSPPSSLRFSLSLLFSEVYRKQARTDAERRRSRQILVWGKSGCEFAGKRDSRSCEIFPSAMLTLLLLFTFIKSTLFSR